MSAMDYVWLLVYFICLYLFYAAFWYSLWLIYTNTTSAGKKPRRPALTQMLMEKHDGGPVPYGSFTLVRCIESLPNETTIK